MLAWITYGGPDGIGALDLGGGTLFSFFYSEVRTYGRSAHARKQSRQSSCVPYPSAQQDCATNSNKCLSEKKLTRKQARTHSVNLCPFVLVHKTQTKCFCHPLYV
eukprot:scaffold2703_cov129-Isochrysis_galbana.AAC.4